MTWLRTAGNRCSIGQIHGVDVLRPAESNLGAADEGSSGSDIETSKSSYMGMHAREGGRDTLWFDIPEK